MRTGLPISLLDKMNLYVEMIPAILRCATTKTNLRLRKRSKRRNYRWSRGRPDFCSHENDTAKVQQTEASCDFTKAGVKSPFQGMCKSSSKTDGLKSPIICIVSAKFDASPTTSISGSSYNTRRIDRRIISLSSATSTLIDIF